MDTNQDQSTISDPAELAELTDHFIEQFCSQIAFPSSLTILVERHARDGNEHLPQAGPVYAKLEHQKLTIHLFEKALVGISPPALQGCLDMALAYQQLALEPKLYRFNFQKQFRPLFYISGSGLHMVRQMVAHLETGLKNLIAAQMLIDIGHGKPLFYYYYHKINPSVGDAENYQRLVAHQWIRAIFLCNINKDFAPVALLKQTGIAPELESYWWRCHTYLSPEDKGILKALFKQSNQNPVIHFAEILVGLFKIINSQLLTQ
ncbi:MAG: hypothetical protein QNI95_09695 [Desulfobacterales bacterium]|nr:hypothetical protein [Desulfobacterales bacterium]